MGRKTDLNIQIRVALARLGRDAQQPLPRSVDELRDMLVELHAELREKGMLKDREPAIDASHNIWANTYHLVDGDPMNPTSGDIIAHTAQLNVGEPVPDGWRVLSGNPRSSTIGRLVLRYELEDLEA